MLGHVTFDAIQRLLHRLRAMQKQRERELERLQSAFEADAEERQSIQSNAKEDDEEQQQDDPPSHYRHQHHKPKKDTFYTKQQIKS